MRAAADRHGSGFDKSTGGCLVELGAGEWRLTLGGVPADEQNVAGRQLGGGVPAARGGHRRGERERAGRWIEDLARIGCFAASIDDAAARHQHSPIEERRCGVRGSLDDRVHGRDVLDGR